jgi:hypothetical protein
VLHAGLRFRMATETSATDQKVICGHIGLFRSPFEQSSMR